jgi:hypothetical protein
MGDKTNAYWFMLGKLEGKSSLGKPRPRWLDNIKVDLRVIRIGWGGIGWIDVAQDREEWKALVNTVMNLRFPYARQLGVSREGLSPME